MLTRTVLIPIALSGALACGGGYNDGTNPPPPQATLGSIVATPTTLNLAAGQRTTLTMQALNTSNQPIANASGYVFTSNGTTVASVSSGGEVTGLTAGAATITASLTLGSVTKTVDVPVTVTGTLPLTASVTAGATSDTFTPNFVSIARTGSVTWTFGARLHNVNFEGAAGTPGNIGDSINESETRTFNTAGNFSYVCTIHPSMTGTVLVQ